jgi:signal peptidase I
VAGALHAANVAPRPPGSGAGRLHFSAIALGSLPALTAVVAHSVMTFAPTYSMPSPSMEPTLAMNRPFLVVLSAYRWIQPARGDLVLYRSNSELGQISRVSRIIGMPGDTVAMKGGIPIVNGAPLARRQIGNYPLREGARIADVNCFIETLADGTSYSVLEQDSGKSARYDNHPAYTVPAGAYFVISDNRDGARDSRDMQGVGFVRDHSILGRAIALRATPDAIVQWRERLAGLRAMVGF